VVLVLPEPLQAEDVLRGLDADPRLVAVVVPGDSDTVDARAGLHP
jgi:hypothetical protein